MDVRPAGSRERAKVTELILPDRAGLSNETILFRAALTAKSDDGGTNTTTEDLVLRVSPAPENQLFRDTLFESQARLLHVLHDERNLKVPNVRWFESDPKWFDRPFFVMDHADRSGPDQRPDLQRRGMAVRRDASAAAHRVGRERSTSSSASTRPHPSSSASSPGARQGSPRCSTRSGPSTHGRAPGASTRSSTGCGSGSTRTCRRHHPSGCRGATPASATRCSTTTSSWSS